MTALKTLMSGVPSVCIELLPTSYCKLFKYKTCNSMKGDGKHNCCEHTSVDTTQSCASVKEHQRQHVLPHLPFLSYDLGKAQTDTTWLCPVWAVLEFAKKCKNNEHTWSWACLLAYLTVLLYEHVTTVIVQVASLQEHH